MADEEDLELLLREAVREQRTISRAHIYTLNDHIIGKMTESGKHARIEFKYGRRLFNEGISVPEVYGLVPPDNDNSSYVDGDNDVLAGWYILMQRINGEDMIDLEGIELEEAKRQYTIEMRKVLDLGIYPADGVSGFNAMFDKDWGILYLIDFEYHKVGNLKELNQAYNDLRKGVDFR